MFHPSLTSVPRKPLRNQLRSLSAVWLVLSGPIAATELDLVSFAPPIPHDLAAGDTEPKAITPDGRYVLLETTAPNLVPGPLPTIGCTDVVLHDRATGIKRRVTSASGAPAPTGGTVPGGNREVISDDGQVVIFDRAWGQPCFEYAAPGSWIADFRSGTVKPLTESLPPIAGLPKPAPTNVRARALSGDGHVVLLAISDQLVLFDRQANTARLITHSSGNSAQAGNGESLLCGLSSNGRYVGLVSRATNLVPGYKSPGLYYQLYLFDSVTGTMRLVSSATGQPDRGANRETGGCLVTPDGKVAFASLATNLVAAQRDDGFESPDIFAFDPTSGVRLVSHEPGAPTQAIGRANSLAGQSANGRFVLFNSLGLPIAGTDHNPSYDIFLHDRTTLSTELVSRRLGSATDTADQASLAMGMSRDGRFAYFASKATDLASGSAGRSLFRFDRTTATVSTLLADTDARAVVAAEAPVLALVSGDRDLALPLVDLQPNNDAFVLDTETLEIELLSPATQPARTTSRFDAFGVIVSADGGTVAYQNGWSDLVAAPLVYWARQYAVAYDRLADHNEFLSHGPGNPLDGRDGVPVALSADGRYVLLESIDSLTAGETPLTYGLTKVYLYDRQTDTARLVSHLADQPSTAGAGAALDLSADGRFVLWASGDSGFVPGVTAAFAQLYLWDRDLDTHRLVSRGLGGPTEAGNGHSTENLTGSRPAAELSADGRRTLFASTASNLAPGDSGNSVDLFLFDAVTGDVRRLSHPPGQPGSFLPNPPTAARLDAAGRFVAFSTSSLWGSGAVYLWDSVAGDTATLLSSPGYRVGITDFTADGRQILLSSADPALVPGQIDTNLGGDVFLLEVPSGNRRLVSHRFDSPNTAEGGSSARFVGSRVAFLVYHADRLVPGVVSNRRELLLYDLSSGRAGLLSHLPEQPLVGAGIDNEQAYSIAASADGSVVALSSSSGRLYRFDLDYSVLNNFPDVFESGADVFLYRPDSLFADGFESGNLAAWSAVKP